jgi:hypothetical protein
MTGYHSGPETSSASNTGGGIWSEEGVASVPEPSTWAMLLIGFAGIGFVSWRRVTLSDKTSRLHPRHVVPQRS